MLTFWYLTLIILLNTPFPDYSRKGFGNAGCRVLASNSLAAFELTFALFHFANSISKIPLYSRGGFTNCSRYSKNEGGAWSVDCAVQLTDILDRPVSQIVLKYKQKRHISRCVKNVLRAGFEPAT